MHKSGLGNKQECFYCSSSEPLKREHVLPEALGVNQTTVKGICKKCNEGVLSQLDEHFCAFSPVSFVAADEIEGYIRYLWDYDGPLLLEAKYERNLKTISLKPQMILDAGLRQFRGSSEIIQHTPELFREKFVTGMLSAFRDYQKGNTRRLQVQHVRIVPEERRLPPRIFCNDLSYVSSNESTYIVRYDREDDKKALLHELDYWSLRSKRGRGRTEYRNGSPHTAIQSIFEPSCIVRYLQKMSLNFLGYLCSKTPLQKEDFLSEIEIILGESTVPQIQYSMNGFVAAADLSPMNVKQGTHKCWVMYDQCCWTVYLGLFGGRIFTKSTLRGESREDWFFADVTIPYQPKKRWETTYSRVIHPLVNRYIPIEWHNQEKVIPSIPIINFSYTVK